MKFDDFVFITCEHASSFIPPELRDKYGSRVWEKHEVYDLCAADLSRKISEELGISSVFGEASRLVVDLNRSIDSRFLSRLVHRDKPEFGKLVLEPHRKFRQKVERELRRRQPCIHISVHSFTRVFNGKTRSTDIGVLLDPKSLAELNFSRAFKKLLVPSGETIHLNRPYRGTTDGHTSHLRALFQKNQYAGIELEVCNDLLVHDFSSMSRVIIDSLKESLSQVIFTN